MNTGKAPVCLPTWRGHIETTKDALIIFEACFNGQLAHCFRRPHDRERNQLIVSGNVFVYEEATSGIKRWTDGIPWSPSRILTNFLIYRQLNNPFPPGEKKRATKRGQRPARLCDPYTPTSRAVDTYSSPTKAGRGDDNYRFSPVSPVTPGIKGEDGEMVKDPDRCLLGSLIDSYEFKENGLLKKTMTVVINNVQHHLVSYYSLDDAKHNLETPRDDPRLRDTQLRPELLNQPKFKFQNFDDAGDGSYDQMDQNTAPYGFYAPTAVYDPSRQQSGAVQGHASSHPDTSPGYYHPAAIAQYPTPSPSYHSNGQQSNPSSLPATTSSAYMPMSSTPTAYHAQNHHSQTTHSHPHHGQPANHHQGGSGSHHSQSQSHHQTGHHAQSSFSHGGQYSSQQTLPYHETAHQINFHSPPISNALPRPVGSLVDFGAPMIQDAFGATSDYYGSNASSVTAGTETTCMLPQPWQMTYQSPAYAHRSS